MDFTKIMKQAKEMQQKVQDAQAELENKEVEGSAGAGMVKVTMTAKSVAKKVEIDPSLIEAKDKEMIEDLVTAAFNDAKNKADDLTEKVMKEATDGLALPPGINMPF